MFFFLAQSLAPIEFYARFMLKVNSIAGWK